jgi:hypothetical protein
MQIKENKRKYKLRRNIALTFRVTPEERDMIDKRMREAGTINRRHFLLNIALKGRIIRIELDSVNKMTMLLSNVSNNINQIARRVNETGNIYLADINDINLRLDEIWEQHRNIYSRLIKIQEALT